MNPIIPISLLVLLVATVLISIVVARFHQVLLVHEGQAGLLYHEGKLVDTLAAGRHVRWGKNYRLTLVETRKTLLQVAGQEVLSADHISVKLSVILTTQIVDPAKNARAADNPVAHLYSATQAALRNIVAGVTVEALLTQRAALGEPLRTLVAPAAESIGLQLHHAEVRDVMLPGELRKAFSEVLKVRQEGQAALERARSETAALRNLANAARLLEGQPALATLRFLQTLEASDTSRTLVLNDLTAFLPALKARASQAGSNQPEP